MRPTFICLRESVPETCEGEATKFEPIDQWKLHRNHWPQRGWVVLRRLGVSTSKQHKGKKNPPEINSAQIWQVFHKRDDWEWLYGDECSLSKGLPNSNTAVPWFKQTLSSVREALTVSSEFFNLCRSSASFMWYLSASFRRTFSLNTECEASSSCLKSLQDKILGSHPCEHIKGSHWKHKDSRMQVIIQ